MMKKILFYATNPYVFRSGPVGYLYEISQVYPTIFLSEKLDPETDEILRDKTLFPKLEKIILIHQFTRKNMNLFAKNIFLFKLAKNIISQYKPDIIISSRYKPNIIISPSDMRSLFDLYLMRLGKRENILRIATQPANIADSVTIAKWVDLTNAYLRFPSFLPFWLRLFLVKCRKYLGHFLYYWILPLTIGEKPFFGKSSHILRKGQSGMRDADYQTVFSKRDYDIYLKDGVPAEKLYILTHPLQTETKEFFKKAFWKRAKKKKKDRKIVTLLLPEDEIGFRRKNNSLILKEEMQKTRIEITNLITKVLSDWIIYLKPHPDIKDKDVKKNVRPFEVISNRIKIVDKTEPVDKYIEIADVIIELPLSASTALFTASLQCLETPIISLDFPHELFGDFYKDFEGIEYIDNREKFIKILKLIRDNKYQKKPKTKLEPEGFSNTIELLEHLC